MKVHWTSKARLYPPHDLDDDGAYEVLQDRAGRLFEASEAINRPSIFLSMEPDARIDAVLHAAENLQVATEAYRRAVLEAQERQKEQITAEKSLFRLKKELEKVRPRAERAEAAVETLKGIYENDSKEQNLVAAMKRHSDASCGHAHSMTACRSGSFN
jgi:septum formation inhibitor MinC